MTVPRRAWRFWAPGDLNAFSGLVVDNLTQLVVLTGILVGVFRFPADLVLYRIVPGPDLCAMFRLAEPTPTYGRTAFIYLDGYLAIELLEIVPPE